jgi:hypothetical protein
MVDDNLSAEPLATMWRKPMRWKFSTACVLATAALATACLEEDEGDGPGMFGDASSPVLPGTPGGGGVGDAGGFNPTLDAGVADAGSVVPRLDAGVLDAGGLVPPVDAGFLDAGSTDSGSAIPGDAGLADSGRADGGTAEGGTADGGAADAGAGGCGADTYMNFGQAFFMMHCIGCHGMQATFTGGGVRLDSIANIRMHTEHIIEHAVELELPIMPLGTMGRPQAERDRLKKWLDCGAP